MERVNAPWSDLAEVDLPPFIDRILRLAAM